MAAGDKTDKDPQSNRRSPGRRWRIYNARQCGFDQGNPYVVCVDGTCNGPYDENPTIMRPIAVCGIIKCGEMAKIA